MTKLRDIDDTIIDGIKTMDTLINASIVVIVSAYPDFIIDYLIKDTYLKITTGGVRIFSGSRKKADIKVRLLTLVSKVNDATDFITYMIDQGLIRGVREKLVLSFLSSIQNDYTKFIGEQKDPYVIYQKIYGFFYAYRLLRNPIIQITFNRYSKVVLYNYKGWEIKRDIKSTLDCLEYEEDIQNSYFNIPKAIKLFDPTKHKSFFAYASNWLKEGIDSSEYAISNDQMLSMEENSSEIANLADENSIDPETALIEAAEKEAVSVLSFTDLSFPLGSEVRIFYKLLKLSKEKS